MGVGKLIDDVQLKAASEKKVSQGVLSLGSHVLLCTC